MPSWSHFSNTCRRHRCIPYQRPTWIGPVVWPWNLFEKVRVWGTKGIFQAKDSLCVKAPTLSYIWCEDACWRSLLQVDLWILNVHASASLRTCMFLPSVTFYLYNVSFFTMMMHVAWFVIFKSPFGPWRPWRFARSPNSDFHGPGDQGRFSSTLFIQKKVSSYWFWVQNPTFSFFLKHDELSYWVI